MLEIEIDGQKLEVPDGSTVMDATNLAGVYVPHFCYHKKLSIAANCRMCLVQVEKAPKPLPACATPVTNGMTVFTHSEQAVTAQKGVMEFLLINHPLDCPICDQGGECDLQDQSIAYGKGQSRFHENKRAVTDKYMGPIVKTTMTRCIQCTRCVRFAEEVSGVEEIGAIYRGENMQITSYLEQAVTSELSGNVVDLCPVGALTSKPYAFEARPWELKKTPGIDVMDAVGTNVRFDSRGRQVLRVLPRINEDVNEEWASDKTRHAVDGLVRRRLDRPYVRKAGKLVEASWAEAFAAIKAVKAGSSAAAIAGDQLDCETMYAAKALLAQMGSTLLEGRQTGMDYDVSNLAAVNFNSTIAGIETADAVLIVGSNLRWEAPLINTRVRKAVKRSAAVFAIGEQVNLTYPVEWLGNDLGLLGKLPSAVTDAFAKAQRPALILGGGGLKAGAQGATLALVASLGLIKDDWNGYNVVHLAAARMGGLMLGYGQKGGLADLVAAAPKLLFLLGADDVDVAGFGKSFKVYIGHHGDAGAAAADVVLPGAAYTEKPGTYVNTEGRVQRSDRAVFPPGDAREDWAILRALSDVLGHKLPFDSFDALRAAMAAEVPDLGVEGLADYAWAPPKLAAAVSGPVSYPIKDFYLTNPIARASDTMQRCSAELLHGQSFAEAAE